MAKTCVMMVAGERSGDVYGGELAAALRSRLPSIEIFGCGGDAMRASGVETVVEAQQFSLLGIVEVFSALPQARRAFLSLIEEAERRRPALAVLIDSPSLNLRVAKRLKRRKIPVVYFVSPQVWAWKRWRIRHLKARVDKMICIFDFEEKIYRQAGIPVEYVGHPLVDLVRHHHSRPEFFAQAGLDPHTTTVALLPGSREREVSFNFPAMLDCASRLALARKIQFVLAIAPSLNPLWLEAKLHECYVGRATVRAVTDATHDALQHSDVAIVASGTATLEAVLRDRPMVVVYRVSPLTWLMGKFMVDIPFYSMANLLAGKPVVTELIQHDFTATKLAERVEFLLDHPEARDEMVKEFQAIKKRLGPGGAIQRAAEAVLGVLGKRSVSRQAG